MVFTRQSLSLTHSIQQHITTCWNQTTLGLAVTLHHRVGSNELITILHDYGYTVTYDEVFRFESSVAKYASKRSFDSECLRKDDSPVSAWFANYDLDVCTPNWRRETHAMVVLCCMVQMDAPE